MNNQRGFLIPVWAYVVAVLAYTAAVGLGGMRYGVLKERESQRKAQEQAEADRQATQTNHASAGSLFESQLETAHDLELSYYQALHAAAAADLTGNCHGGPDRLRILKAAAVGTAIPREPPAPEPDSVPSPGR